MNEFRGTVSVSSRSGACVVLLSLALVSASSHTLKCSPPPILPTNNKLRQADMLLTSPGSGSGWLAGWLVGPGDFGHMNNFRPVSGGRHNTGSPVAKQKRRHYL